MSIVQINGGEGDLNARVQARALVTMDYETYAVASGIAYQSSFVSEGTVADNADFALGVKCNDQNWLMVAEPNGDSTDPFMHFSLRSGVTFQRHGTGSTIYVSNRNRNFSDSSGLIVTRALNIDSGGNKSIEIATGVLGANAIGPVVLDKNQWTVLQMTNRSGAAVEVGLSLKFYRLDDLVSI